MLSRHERIFFTERCSEHGNFFFTCHMSRMSFASSNISRYALIFIRKNFHKKSFIGQIFCRKNEKKESRATEAENLRKLEVLCSSLTRFVVSLQRTVLDWGFASNKG